MNDSEEKIIKACLILPEIPSDFDPNAKPQSGEEYLMHMAYERNSLPVISFLPGHQSKSFETKEARENEECGQPKTKKHSPNIEWKAYQLADFKRIRTKIEKLRENLCENGYNANSMNLPLTENEDDWKIFVESNQPLISTIIRINQQSLELLLEFVAKWLKETPIHGEENKWLGSWLYSACACLTFPFDVCVYSVLRNIAKTCLQYREGFSDEQEKEAIPYNLIVLIVAEVFGQKDFNEVL